MVALLVEGRGMWRIEGLGRWVTSVSELPGALTRTNSHAARRGPGALIQRAFSWRYFSPLLRHRGERRRGGFHPFLRLIWPRLASPRHVSPRLATILADAPMNGLKLPRALSTLGPYTLRLYMTFHSDTVKGDVAVTSTTILSAIVIRTTIPYPSQVRDAALSPADTDVIRSNVLIRSLSRNERCMRNRKNINFADREIMSGNISKHVL